MLCWRSSHDRTRTLFRLPRAVCPLVIQHSQFAQIILFNETPIFGLHLFYILSVAESAGPHAAVQALVLVGVVEHLLMRTLAQPRVIGIAGGYGSGRIRLEFAAHVLETGARGDGAGWERSGRGEWLVFRVKRWLKRLDGR